MSYRGDKIVVTRLSHGFVLYYLPSLGHWFTSLSEVVDAIDGQFVDQ